MDGQMGGYISERVEDGWMGRRVNGWAYHRRNEWLRRSSMTRQEMGQWTKGRRHSRWVHRCVSSRWAGGAREVLLVLNQDSSQTPWKALE